LRCVGGKPMQRTQQHQQTRSRLIRASSFVSSATYSLFATLALIAELVGKPNSEYAWLIHRLAQVEVALVGINHRILIGEIADVELGIPMGVDLIKTKTQVHDRIAWLQYARQAIGTGGF